MLAVAACIGGLLVGGVLVAIYALQTSARSVRQSERREQTWGIERRELLNRIMLLAGTPYEYPEQFDAAPEQEEELILDPMLMPIPTVEDEILTH